MTGTEIPIEGRNELELKPIKVYIVAKVAALLDEVQSELGREREFGEHRALLARIKGALQSVVKAQRTDASIVDVHRVLCRQLGLPQEAEHAIPAQLKALPDTIVRFCRDLAYLVVFERGGLDALNALLAEHIAALRKYEHGVSVADESEDARHAQMEMTRRTEAINDLLCRAIELFPHVATGVAVTLRCTLDADVTARPGEEWRKAEEHWCQCTHSDGRSSYPALVIAWAKAHGGTMPPATLVFPLPYWFTTGTYGSGERAARGTSREEIRVENTLELGEDETRSSVVIPMVKCAIEKPLLVQRLTPFFLDEVESVRFMTGNATYVPMVNADKCELVSRGTTWEHYLAYWDFCKFIPSRPSRYMQMTDEEWHAERWSLLESHQQRRALWVKSEDRRYLENGFLVRHRNGAESVLYEFRDVELPQSSTLSRSEAGDVTPVVLLQNAERGKYGDHVRTYRGMDIIRRLMVIPQGPWHF